MAAFYVQTSVMDLLNIYLNIYQELKRTIMDLDLQITRKHPAASVPILYLSRYQH